MQMYSLQYDHLDLGPIKPMVFHLDLSVQSKPVYDKCSANYMINTNINIPT